MTHYASIVVPADQVAQINKWLDMNSAVEDCGKDGILYKQSVTFRNTSVEADFKVVNSKSGPWSEIVVFVDGNEYMCTDPEYSFSSAPVDFDLDGEDYILTLTEQMEYTAERIIQLPDGCTMRTTEHPDVWLDYIRFVGPDGVEEVYWSEDEWVEADKSGTDTVDDIVCCLKDHMDFSEHIAAAKAAIELIKSNPQWSTKGVTGPGLTVLALERSIAQLEGRWVTPTAVLEGR